VRALLLLLLLQTANREKKMKKVKIVVPEDHNIDERWAPVLMSFPHGAPPLDSLDAGSNRACSLTTHVALKNGQPTARRAAVLTTPAVRFIGSTMLPSGALDSSTSSQTRKRPATRDASHLPCERYLIAQLDKTDNTLLLMEGGDIFEMEVSRERVCVCMFERNNATDF
jgi:hypothetical protein